MNEQSLTAHPPPSGDVRTLLLPSGGTMDIPLPGSKARFAVRQKSLLADAETCPHLASTVMICLAVGAAIGVGAAAWYYSRR